MGKLAQDKPDGYPPFHTKVDSKWKKDLNMKGKSLIFPVRIYL